MNPMPDATPAKRLLLDHLRLRAQIAASMADEAADAWQGWIDRPAFDRQEQAHVGEHLATAAARLRRVADDAANLRPKFCTVELDAATATCALLVGLA